MSIAERLQRIKERAAAAGAAGERTEKAALPLAAPVPRPAPAAVGALIERARFAPPPPQGALSGVKRCGEFERVLALPRRQLDLSDDLAARMTAELRAPDGTMQLWPIQAAALEECRRANGLIAPIGCGFGKTLISLLAPVVLQSRRAVLLVPPQLRDQLLGVDAPFWARHFRIPLRAVDGEDVIRVVAYSTLSLADHAEVLEELRPDLIVADECHQIRSRAAARSRRFLRYLHDHPGTRLVAMSGTMTSRSLLDFAHFCEHALGKGSPVPSYRRGWSSLMEWAQAIDVPRGRDERRPPGVLKQFTQKGEEVRAGFRRRLVETSGVAATEEQAIGTSLVVAARRPEIPAEVRAVLDDLEARWAIGAEEIEDATRMAAYRRQIAMGFYYRWRWPDGRPDLEWLEARAAWHAEVRDMLKHARPGMDSPLLLARAAIAGRWRSWAWDGWAAVKDRPEPETEAVWISSFVVEDAAAWARENDPGIVWYEHVALGEAVAARLGAPLAGEGDQGAARLRLAADQGRTVVVSIWAHSTGKNLQHAYSRQIVLCPLASGTLWEQMLSRTHRPGQEADEVRCDVNLHTEALERSLRSAVEDARYKDAAMGQRQKLLCCQPVGWTRDVPEAARVSDPRAKGGA